MIDSSSDYRMSMVISSSHRYVIFHINTFFLSDNTRIDTRGVVHALCKEIVVFTILSQGFVKWHFQESPTTLLIVLL